MASELQDEKGNWSAFDSQMARQSFVNVDGDGVDGADGESVGFEKQFPHSYLPNPNPPSAGKLNSSLNTTMTKMTMTMTDMTTKRKTTTITTATTTIPLIIHSKSVGNVIIVLNSTSPEVTQNCDLKTAFLEINVEKSASLHSVCDIVGWTYFVS